MALTGFSFAHIRDQMANRIQIIRDFNEIHNIPQLKEANRPTRLFIDDSYIIDQLANHLGVQTIWDFRTIKSDELFVIPRLQNNPDTVKKIKNAVHSYGGSMYEDYQSLDGPKVISQRINASNNSATGKVSENTSFTNTVTITKDNTMGMSFQKLTSTVVERRQKLPELLQKLYDETGIKAEVLDYLNQPIPSGFIKSSIVQNHLRNGMKIERLIDFTLVSPDELRHAVETIDGVLRGQIQKAVNEAGGWFYKDWPETDRIKSVIKKYQKNNMIVQPPEQVVVAEKQEDNNIKPEQPEIQANKEVMEASPVPREDEVELLEIDLDIHGQSRPAFFATPLDRFDLSQLTLAALSSNNINIIGDFRYHTEEEMLSTPGINVRMVEEIKEKLIPYGLLLFTDLKDKKIVESQIKKGFLMIISGQPVITKPEPQAISSAEPSREEKLKVYDEKYGFNEENSPEYFSLDVETFGLRTGFTKQMLDHGIEILGDLRKFTAEELHDMPYVKQKDIDLLKEAMLPYGLLLYSDLADENYVSQQIKTGTKAYQKLSSRNNSPDTEDQEQNNHVNDKEKENTMTTTDIKKLKKELDVNTTSHPYLKTKITTEHATESLVANMKEAGITRFIDLCNYTEEELIATVKHARASSVEKMKEVLQPLGVLFANDLADAQYVATQLAVGDAACAPETPAATSPSKNTDAPSSQPSQADAKKMWQMIDKLAESNDMTTGKLGANAGLDQSTLSPSKRVSPRTSLYRHISTESLQKLVDVYKIDPATLPKAYRDGITAPSGNIQKNNAPDNSNKKQRPQSTVAKTRDAEPKETDETRLYKKIGEMLGNKKGLFTMTLEEADAKLGGSSALFRFASNQFDLVGEVAMLSFQELKECGMSPNMVGKIRTNIEDLGLSLGLREQAQQQLANEKKEAVEKKVSHFRNLLG